MSEPVTSETWPDPEAREAARDPLSRPFWRALEAGTFTLPRCGACGAAHFYPRPLCPHCASPAWAFEPASAAGVVLAATTQQRAPEPQWAADVPYTLARVRLDEGVSLLARAPNDMAPGARVVVAAEPIGEAPFLRLTVRAG